MRWWRWPACRIDPTEGSSLSFCHSFSSSMNSDPVDILVDTVGWIFTVLVITAHPMFPALFRRLLSFLSLSPRRTGYSQMVLTDPFTGILPWFDTVLVFPSVLSEPFPSCRQIRWTLNSSYFDWSDWWDLLYFGWFQFWPFESLFVLSRSCLSVCHMSSLTAATEDRGAFQLRRNETNALGYLTY